MRRICCNCNAIIKEQIPGTEDDDRVSHGICKKCVLIARRGDEKSI